MGKYLLAVVVTFIIITVYYLYMFNTQKGTPGNSLSPTVTQAQDRNRQICEENNGKWTEEFKECEGISLSACQKYGREYSSCASPCRHNPKAQVCIQSCAAVCKF